MKISLFEHFCWWLSSQISTNGINNIIKQIITLTKVDSFFHSKKKTVRVIILSFANLTDKHMIFFSNYQYNNNILVCFSCRLTRQLLGIKRKDVTHFSPTASTVPSATASRTAKTFSSRRHRSPNVPESSRLSLGYVSSAA